MSKVIVGVMGPGETASDKEIRTAYELGKLIAKQKWILPTPRITSWLTSFLEFVITEESITVYRRASFSSPNS